VEKLTANTAIVQNALQGCTTIAAEAQRRRPEAEPLLPFILHEIELNRRLSRALLRHTSRIEAVGCFRESAQGRQPLNTVA
jgi:hypothetical protein